MPATATISVPSAPPSQRSSAGVELAAAALWALATAAVWGLPYALGAGDAGDAIIRNTIRLSLALYFAAAVALLLLRPTDWTATTRRGRVARVLWTAAWAEYLVHLAAAMHFYHGWSHAHAVQHTHETTGLGAGIWFSHLFTLIWTADVLYWRFAPAAYAARSPWRDRLLHGYMTFIIFNGTVVWEPGPIRIAGAVGFAALFGLLLMRLKNPKPGEPDA